MNAIDLFCGAGGFSYGFEVAGINVLYGYDNNEDCIDTYNENHTSEGVVYDICDDVPNIEEDIDIIFGSPPCKGFSDARGSRYVDNEDNGLVFEFIRWVSDINPNIVLIENVKGIRTISDDFIDGVKKELTDEGYDTVKSFVLNSEDFNIPQSRERFFILALNTDNLNIKKDLDVENKIILDDTDNKLKTGKMNIEDAIMDLPEECEGTVNTSYDRYNTLYTSFVKDSDITYNHKSKKPNMDDEYISSIINNVDSGQVYRSNRNGDKYVPVWDVFEDRFTNEEIQTLKIIAKNRNKQDYQIDNGYVKKSMLPLDEDELEGLVEKGWLRSNNGGYDINTKSGVRPKYRRLDLNDTSGTILTTDFRPREKLHPVYNRGISLREGARIQSFPDSFKFKGSYTSISNQIGNAVPPILSYSIGRYIMNLN